MNALRSSLSVAVVVYVGLYLVGCGSNNSSADDAGSGGRSTEGGATGSGGSSTGGTTGTGGWVTGGANGSGGATGGTIGSGGASTGGVTGSGGASTGGTTGTSGAAGKSGGTTGGTTGTGGAAGKSGGTGAAGAGGKGGATGTAGQPGMGGGAGVGPEAPGGNVTGYGTVSFISNPKVQITRLQTTLTVPTEPPASGTLFLWPGLQPDGANYNPIGNGVLQPVLTWGNSCAPGNQPRAYSTWWISAQYVNTDGSDPGYMGCYGGAVMSVKVGDQLNIDMHLAGTVWAQTVTDEQSSQSVNFSFDMMNQAQNIAYFVIEEYSSAPVSEVIFTNTTLTFASSDPGDCKLAMRGQTDFVSVPVASSDGLECAIQEIILRAQGIQ